MLSESAFSSLSGCWGDMVNAFPLFFLLQWWLRYCLFVAGANAVLCCVRLLILGKVQLGGEEGA